METNTDTDTRKETEDKAGTYRIYYMIFMLCILFFSLGYGYAYKHSNIVANKALHEYIGNHCVVPCPKRTPLDNEEIDEELAQLFDLNLSGGSDEER